MDYIKILSSAWNFQIFLIFRDPLNTILPSNIFWNGVTGHSLNTNFKFRWKIEKYTWRIDLEINNCLN